MIGRYVHPPTFKAGNKGPKEAVVKAAQQYVAGQSVSAYSSDMTSQDLLDNARDYSGSWAAPLLT